MSAQRAAYNPPKLEIVREAGYIKSITLDGQTLPAEHIISVSTKFDPSAFAEVTVTFVAELTIRDDGTP